MKRKKTLHSKQTKKYIYTIISPRIKKKKKEKHVIFL